MNKSSGLMEKAEWKKRLRGRQVLQIKFHLNQWKVINFLLLPSTFRSAESGSKGQAWLWGYTYFRRELCGPGWPQTVQHNIPLPFWTPVGDNEGHVPYTLLLVLNSLGAWLFPCTGPTSHSSHSIQIPLSFWLRLLSGLSLQFLYLFFCIPFSPRVSSLC